MGFLWRIPKQTPARVQTPNMTLVLSLHVVEYARVAEGEGEWEAVHGDGTRKLKPPVVLSLLGLGIVSRSREKRNPRGNSCPLTFVIEESTRLP